MAYQFVHVETYSRKADRHGRSVAWVLDEAERREGSCPHVPSPQPAEVVNGMALADVRRVHDEAAASHVVTLSVVRHTDETHAHLHAYILPGDLRASRLHPGAEAKRTVVESGALTGEAGKALNRRGDVAYKAALRAWQDSYWRDVGLPSGLTRLGPARRRLTRAEWHTERVACRAVKEATERADRIERRATSLLTEAETDAAQVEARAQAMFSHAGRKARETVGTARTDAGRILSSARADAASLQSFGNRLRRFWDGLRHSSIREAVRREVAAEVARLKVRIDGIAERLNAEIQKRREAERRAAEASASARTVGRDRDRLRRELDALRPVPEVGMRLGLKPMGRGS